MIYTIGHTWSYSQYFKEQAQPQKKGRTFDYFGGSVWQTPEEAQRHCIEGFSVYGVMADWTDTTPSPLGDWHDLLIDADLVEL